MLRAGLGVSPVSPGSDEDRIHDPDPGFTMALSGSALLVPLLTSQEGPDSAGMRCMCWEADSPSSALPSLASYAAIQVPSHSREACEQPGDWRRPAYPPPGSGP